jgi:macrolide transport system ATP-binding/permease protein
LRRIRAVFIRLAGFFFRNLHERELSDELESHLQLHIADNIRAGMSQEAAKRDAILKLGGIENTKESYRDQKSIPQLEMLARDLRYAARMLRGSPGFTAAAVLSLALGIGANTAIYSFMDAILFRGLPVQNPESLVGIDWQTKDRPTVARGAYSFYPDPRTGFTGINFPYATFELLRASNSVCSSIFAYSNYGAASLNLIVQGEAGLTEGQYVSGEFFSGLGVRQLAGRLIDSTDERPGSPSVAVIGSALWRRRFGGRADAIGQSVLIKNVPFTVVGVLPSEFYGPGLTTMGAVPEIFIPLRSSLLLDTQTPRFADRNFSWVELMGRLRPGISRAQAEAAMVPMFHQFAASTARTQKDLANLPELFLKEDAGGEGLEMLRRQYSKPLYILMSLVGLILVIACANIANLLLARATNRRREIAIRLSIGASRARIIRQLLTESVLLALLGGTLGVPFAMWAMRALTMLLANGRDNFTLHAELNWHVLAIAIALSILTGLLFGLAPALQATRADVPIRRRFIRFKLSQTLVVSQIAVSLLLLVTAGLFVRTLTNLRTIRVGFNKDNLLLFTINARQAGLKDDAMLRLYGDLQRRLAAIPGVRVVSMSNYAVLSGSIMPVGVTVAGASPETSGRANAMAVGHSFFTTMQIPILLGREINEADTIGARAVGVTSEEFAKKYYGTENPIGKHFKLSAFLPTGTPMDVEIVGVSRNARDSSLKREIPPTVYLPYSQDPRRVTAMVYELRTMGDPLALAGAVQRIVRQADPLLPVSGFKTQSAQIDQSINDERTFAMLGGCFAILALLIACVGLYGTVNYSVARRANEIGIRMALGAGRWQVVWMMLREVFVLCLMGAAIGVPVALSASYLVQSFIFGIRPNDPLTIIFALSTLFIAVTVAAYAPARRASSIQPMTALRRE